MSTAYDKMSKEGREEEFRSQKITKPLLYIFTIFA